MTTIATSRRLGAEALGTFWLVLGGCGAAVIAGDQIGYAGIAAAFGLTVLTAAYALGHISGGHFNPAVTVGLAVAGRFAWKDVAGYVAAQVAAAAVAGGVVLAIASGRAGFTTADGFATNGYGSMSPGGYDLLAVAVCEVVLTGMFVAVILGVTAKGAPAGFGPAAIGLALTLIHLVAIPVSNTSVNPARSLGVAFYAGSGPLSQVWMFVLAPLAGAVVAGVLYRAVSVGPRSDDAGAEAR